MQLSSPRGLASCNSPVPGDLIVAARVVKTQTSIIRILGSLSFCRFRTFPCVSLWFALGFDDPGCYYQFRGGRTVATRWQLSRPRGLDSCSPGRQNPNEYHQNTRVLEFLPNSHVSLCFPMVCVWFRRPGLLLSSPRGPDSGDPVATLKSLGT